MDKNSPKWKLNYYQFTDKGGRNYMEDFCCSHIERVDNTLLFGIFGIFDGHGGCEASDFVHKTIKDELVKIDKFWSNDNSDVLESIKMVYCKIQKLLWIERENWIRTVSGFKSTAGTTATIAIIRNGILYTGHVGDSGILLIYLNENKEIESEELTEEHKPDNPVEEKRIIDSGGSLKKKAGINRVVWNRVKISRNNLETDKIPFLAVARSLGDLWSYDINTDCYHVSPEPDVKCIELQSDKHCAVIMGSDGLWNMVNKEMAVKIISLCQYLNRNREICNPAQVLINYCLHQWKLKNIKADNISVIVILLKSEPELGTQSLSLQSSEMDSSLASVFSELLTSNLLPVSDFIPESGALLDSFDDFSPFNTYSSHGSSAQDQDVELLRSYFQSNRQLTRYCALWSHIDNYWHTLSKAFRKNGFKSFPQIVAYLDSCSTSCLETVLLGFPWSICCVEVIDSIVVNVKIKRYIKNQPLLSEFWNSFFIDVIQKNQLSNIFSIEKMKNVLINKTCYIRNWITSLSSSCVISNDLDSVKRSKLSLRKTKIDCSEFSSWKTSNQDGDPKITSEDVCKYFQLKRSASLDYSKSHFYYNVAEKCDISSSTKNFDNGFTTPTNSLSDCDYEISSSGTKKEIIDGISSSTKTLSDVPISLKRKISENVAQLIFIHRNETSDDDASANNDNNNNNNIQKDAIIPKYALTRQCSLIL